LATEVYRYFSRIGENRDGWSLSLDEIQSAAVSAAGGCGSPPRSPCGVALSALHELLWKRRSESSTKTAVTQLLSKILESPAARPAISSGEAMAGPRRLRAARNFLGLALMMCGILPAQELELCWNAVLNSCHPDVFDVAVLKCCAQVF
jgi:hypothetical protein